MISENSFKTMYSIISINLFDRIWVVVVTIAVILFLLPFSFILFDLIRVNCELLHLRAKRALKDVTAPENEELTSFCYKHTALNAKIVENILRGVGHYLPPWWYSSHLGTLVAFGYDPQLQYETEIVKSANDDDCFSLSWYPSRPSNKSVVSGSVEDVLLFFPGLGLSSRSKVSQQVARVAAESGFRVVIVGARGLETPLSSKRPWHPGFYEDAVTAVEYVYRLYGGRDKVRLFLLGYSAGSNITHKTLLHFEQERRLKGEDDLSVPVITAASCVCINYDYLTARAKLESSAIGLVYSMLMCAMCKEILQKNPHVYSSEEEERLTRCLLLSHYDEHVGLTLHGYSSLDHLQDSLSMFNFEDISVPLLAIQPADDPLHMGQVRNNIQLDRVIANPNVIYLESKYGNHFGFYEGAVTEAFSNKTSYSYPPRVAMEFFKTVVEHQNGKINRY
eukprot:gene13271-14576_t